MNLQRQQQRVKQAEQALQRQQQQAQTHWQRAKTTWVAGWTPPRLVLAGLAAGFLAGRSKLPSFKPGLDALKFASLLPEVLERYASVFAAGRAAVDAASNSKPEPPTPNSAE